MDGGENIIYLSAIFLSHLIVFLLSRKLPKESIYKVDLKHMFNIYSEFLLTGSLIKAWLSSKEINRRWLFEERPPIYKDKMMELQGISNRELSITQIEDEVIHYINFLDEKIDKINLYGILSISAIIFPSFITIIMILLFGITPLIITPFIQLLLLTLVIKWIGRE